MDKNKYTVLTAVQPRVVSAVSSFSLNLFRLYPMQKVLPTMAKSNTCMLRLKSPGNLKDNYNYITIGSVSILLSRLISSEYTFRPTI